MIAFHGLKHKFYITLKPNRLKHWAHDSDLRRLKKVRYVLWFMFGVLLAYGYYMMDQVDPDYVKACYAQGISATVVYAEGLFYFRHAFGLFLVDATVLLIANIHIAVFRNPLTVNTIQKVCIECARYGSVAGGFYAIGAPVPTTISHFQYIQFRKSFWSRVMGPLKNWIVVYVVCITYLTI